MEFATLCSGPEHGAGTQASLVPPPTPLKTYLAIGARRGIVWTPFRQTVLSFLWRDGRAWGHYDLADRLRNGSGRVNANSIYRIVDVLKGAGLVVPIVRSKRVQIVPDPALTDWVALQCDACDAIELIQAEAVNAMRGTAAALGFTATDVLIECGGHCRACRVQAVAQPSATGRLLAPEPDLAGAR